MFGMGIDNTKEKKINISSFNTKHKKQNQKVSLKKMFIIFKRQIIKYFLKTCKWFFTKIRNFYHGLRFWKFKKRLNRQGKKFDYDKIFYKIVETRKQRFNKVIITRRRVPYYYINENVFSSIRPKKSIYYLSLKDDEHGGTFIKKTSHKALDESIWDFPVQKIVKKFWDKY